jgi:hypothetical protein
MPLALRDCTFAGPALPEPFVKFELERQLAKLSPIPKETGPESRALQDQWDTYRRKLRSLGESGGDLRVLHHVVEPLAPLLGYGAPQREEKVRTREGDEDGGWWMPTPDGKAGLRAWTVALGTDLDAPNRRGRAYRFSPARVAARVLLAKGERAALLTDGVELRLLLCDPARPDSHIAIALDRTSGWRGSRSTPDSLRLLLALARPRGVAALPDIIEAARLSQTTVTRKLREQARNAVRDFVQGVLDEPANAGRLDAPDLAKTLWEEGLIIVYRLLFVLKMESSADPSRAFSFAATSLWRNSYSPNTALGPAVATALKGVDTGGFLEHSLRTLFRLFSEGLESVELKVSPLGGALFGARTTPTLDGLAWGERAVAHLLDALLWTPGEKKTERERVHYGSLDVEDLGRVYEALLELEPGITAEPMCRLRRAKLEVVVPAAQGAPYRANAVTDEGGDEEEPEEDDDDAPKKGKGKTKVAWVEDIPAGRFFLRTGLGRKSSGSYYTPHPFVRFLVQETLGPQVAERSPQADPWPLRILELKVLDPAMGSGHFLVEACRFLGDALYEACRLCDERASTAEEGGNKALATELRARVEALPDPNNELLDWLPSKAPEGTAGGLSQQRAQALCRRLVAVHCLYGVDKNRLAVELAKLSLWLESYAEGLPLTFMDHRLVCGDSLTGPFLEHLFTWPKAGGPIEEDLLTQGLRERLGATLATALEGVRDLTASVGKDVADLERKGTAKARLDEALAPFRALAAAWAGAVMLGDEGDDGAYLRAVKSVAAGAAPPVEPGLRRMIEVGGGGVVYDLAFPEVFHPAGRVERTGGFDAVVGNPPWDRQRPFEKEFFAAFDISVLDAPNARSRQVIVNRVRANAAVSARYVAYQAEFEQSGAIHGRVIPETEARVGDVNAGRGNADAYLLFACRVLSLAREAGVVGAVFPSAFHSNEGATGARGMYLYQAAMASCFSFENRNKLFEIDSRFKFALVVAKRRNSGTESFLAKFYLHDPSWLFAQEGALTYDRAFVQATGGSYLSFIEVRTEADLAVAKRCYRTGADFLAVSRHAGMRFSVQADVTRDSHRFSDWSSGQGTALPLQEGKVFHQFTDRWSWPPKSQVPLANIADKPDWLERARFHRVAFRGIASSTNERTAIFCLLPPGSIVANSAPVEADPSGRPTSSALTVVGLMNAFVPDWCLRIKASANVNQFILGGVAVPAMKARPSRFLAHSALRLTCNHAGYALLWTEQVGDAWRESPPKHTWPVVAGDDARWAVRAAIDVVVADAYGLSREQYAHVLGSFSHKSYPKAPPLCLAAFDELKSIGLDAFVKKHDPYHDIPLNEALPKPVIEFGRAEAATPDQGALFITRATPHD